MADAVLFWLALGLDLWVCLTMACATLWVFSGLDWKSPREIAALVIMVPAMLWSFVLAVIHGWSLAGAAAVSFMFSVFSGGI